MPSTNSLQILLTLNTLLADFRRLEMAENTANAARNRQLRGIPSHPSKAKRFDDSRAGRKGEQKAQELMNDPERMYSTLRVYPNEFIALCRHLVRTCKAKRWNFGCSIQLRLCIFLSTLAGDVPQRVTAKTYQRSQPTVSRIFSEIARAIVKLGIIVMPREASKLPKRIRDNDSYMPYFQGCVGAIDGTHIKFRPARPDPKFYLNRNGDMTVISLCAVDFHGVFLAHSTGHFGCYSETSVLDGTVIDGLSFPRGCYFLGDFGYPLSRRILTPYKGVRYHLKEFQGDGMEPKNMKELFNMRHSELRNVIEKSFRDLKSQFKMIDENEYSERKQFMIMNAALTLYNYVTLSRKRWRNREKTPKESANVKDGEQDNNSSSESEEDEEEEEGFYYDYAYDGYEKSYEREYKHEDEVEIEDEDEARDEATDDAVNEPADKPADDSDLRLTMRDIIERPADAVWRNKIAKAMWTDYCQKNQLTEPITTGPGNCNERWGQSQVAS